MKKNLCKNITLINDNDNNNCICCFKNDLFNFFYHFVYLFVYIFWIQLFIINESFDRNKDHHKYFQRNCKPLSPKVPSTPSLIDISSMLIFIMYGRTG